MGLPGIFDGINDIDEATARRRFEVKHAVPGEVLIKEGEVGRAMACLIAGTLEIRSGDAVVGHVQPGAILGEVGLFEDSVRTATVVAPDGAELWVLGREEYEELRDTLHPICMNIELQTLDAQVRRLEDTGATIARLGLGIPTSTAPPTGFFAAVRRMFGSGDTRPTEGDAKAALGESSLFADAPEPVLELIAAPFTAWWCGRGAFLCTEGEVGDRMFVLGQGHVDVIVSTDQQPTQVSTLEPGDAFGMVSLARHGRRMSSCVAQQGAVVYQLDRAGWESLVNEPYMVGSTFRRAVIRAFSEQLRFSNAQLADWERRVREDEGTPRPPTETQREALRRAQQGLSAHGRHLGGPKAR